ncbi:MAG: NADH-quinone oxidoreductase subunit C [Rickettsiaceae bacterium]|nr:NADH-quinone oxidoreductase subunit C [Rickettsiaceae bacterium]
MDFRRYIENFMAENNILFTCCENTNLFGYKLASPQSIPLIIDFVKNDLNLRFAVLTDLFGADFIDREKRFEIVYNLLSLKLNQRIIFKIYLSEQEKIQSITNIYPAASWYEREIYDMFGVEFENSSDMRRILTDYGFQGHPLRKDFPLTGHLQVKYDTQLEKVVYEPVSLEQEFRNFDFTSPWTGPNINVLPGDEKANK